VKAKKAIKRREKKNVRKIDVLFSANNFLREAFIELVFIRWIIFGYAGKINCNS